LVGKYCDGQRYRKSLASNLYSFIDYSNRGKALVIKVPETRPGMGFLLNALGQNK